MSPPIFLVFGANLAFFWVYDVVPSGPLGVALATVVFGCFLGNNLDQERLTDAADVAGVIFRLQPELVDAHALRRRDLDSVVVVSDEQLASPTTTPWGVTT